MTVILQNIKARGSIGGDRMSTVHPVLVFYKTTKYRQDRSLTASINEAPRWLLTSQYSLTMVQIRGAPRQGRGATASSASIHAIVGPPVGRAASLTSILSECVACGYSNLIRKPLHACYVTARMTLWLGGCTRSDPSLTGGGRRGETSWRRVCL